MYIISVSHKMEINIKMKVPTRTNYRNRELITIELILNIKFSIVAMRGYITAIKLNGRNINMTGCKEEIKL